MATLQNLLPDSIAHFRKQRAIRQKYRCPICRGSLGQRYTLDHCHQTGHVRSVLCNSCNVGEGKVRAGALFRTTKSNLAYTDTIQWLRNLADYLEYHKENPSGVIHPTFDIRKGKQKPVKRRRKV